MIVLITGVLAVFAFLLLMNWLWAKAQPSVSSKFILIASVVLIGSLGLLTAFGRYHWLAAAGTAILPFLRRGFTLIRLAPMLARVWQMIGGGTMGSPFMQGFDNNSRQSSSAPNISSTETSFLRMNLNHDSGELDGEVLKGEFSGRSLDTLSSTEIVDLYNAIDNESKRVLGAYIQRYHPDLAKEESEASGGSGEQQNSDAMTVDRARKVLGVGDNATKEEIVEAHRRLMQKNHPDRGGSEFLASEINLAKRVLLNQL